jgi:hypothetical protein
VLNNLGQLLHRYGAVRDGATIEGLTLRLFNSTAREWSIY